MISNLNPSSEAFLANVERIQRTLEEASRQTSSGKRVNVASDAPSEIDTILQLKTSQVRNQQIQDNLGVAKTDADAADNALTSAAKMMDRARTLATQGSTFTLGVKSLAPIPPTSWSRIGDTSGFEVPVTGGKATQRPTRST